MCADLSEPCPAGFYRTELGAASLDDCKRCDAGFYCSGGEASVSGTCEAKTYCSTDGNDRIVSTDGDVCSLGFCCPAGTPIELVCRENTYSDVSMDCTNPDSSSGDCLPCQSGFYCETGSNNGTTLCPVGKYCETYSAFRNFGPAPKFGHFWRFSE